MKLSVLYAAVLLAAFVYVISWRRNVDVDRPPFILGPENGAKALVVWHPGGSHFTGEIVRSFARGLARAGWKVEVFAANRDAPMDLSRYDLLVLAGPVYWWSPARPVRRYLQRVKDLHGIETVVLLTAAGAPGHALEESEDLVRRAHGRIRDARTYWLVRRNSTAGEGLRANRRIARELAFDAGAALAPRKSGAA